ncbi:MAG: sulfite exporter TauE/SafE family protein [Candidatus Bathyarchaeota archaeon]|nr:sulfite exporter TauE/SafE family protein [Candidatus Bathyarchaeum tardum]WNZ28434.1 MAG: sulfite exporter TauE/SafE family protein [Candidatus Bathyarchaeota archaeon]
MILVGALLVFVLGFIVGVPSAMVGLGGGVIIVPALIVLFQLPAQNAIAISLVAILGTTVSATIGYVRHKQIDYKLGLLYDVMDVPGIIIGAYITTFLPENILAGICGIFILFITLVLIRNKRKPVCACPEIPKESITKGWIRNGVDHKGNAVKYALSNPALALTSSFVGGIVTGLAGLGGGITDVSSMMVLGIPTHIAVATSHFAMAITNGVGVLTHGLLNNILIEYAIPITLGTVIGAQVGCLLAKRVKGKTIRNLLALIAIISALRLIYFFFTG